ncbi:hypothetical protein ACN47E_002220 [Coniothyrium glycines]
MSNTRLLQDTDAKSAAVFDAFKTHNDAPRVETKTTVFKLIREAYPDHHVTEVDEKRCSLFEYASAGKATLLLDEDGEEFIATREWRPVGEGVEKKMHSGKLRDDFRFARFLYTWQSESFIVYYVAWHDMLKSAEKVFYILSPRETCSIDSGHCTETDKLILAAGNWTSQLHEEIFIFDDGRWEKSKDLWKSVHGSSWDNVILDPDMKKNLIEDVQGFFNNQSIYKDFAVPWKRGVILHGVPGNGKTVSIKALMSSLYSREDVIPSLYVKNLSTNCQTEQYAVRQIFTMARNQAPCLLIFEDLDSLVNDDIRSYFLNEVDGLESNDGILMIGSTNHLDKLDPAIAKRPSRFDRKYHFKLPAEEERRLYALYWRSKLISNETVDFPEDLAAVISQLTEGFSFAYLKELFVMALLSLVRGFKGDDFEIVDKEEAASADEATVAADPAEGVKEKEDAAEVCSCATKCATCHLPVPKPATPAAKKADEAAEAAQELKKQRMIMPTVDVPDHLADNILLKVIKHHIRVLHAEMDNTKDDDKPSGKKDIGSKGANLEMRRRNQRVRGMRAAC